MDKIVEFDNSSKLNFLDLIGKAVDSDGYIVEKTSRERVLTKHGEEVKLADFAGFKKGSEIFIKSDIASLVDYAKD